jgi:hypothetical protein
MTIYYTRVSDGRAIKAAFERWYVSRRDAEV